MNVQFTRIFSGILLTYSLIVFQGCGNALKEKYIRPFPNLVGAEGTRGQLSFVIWDRAGNRLADASITVAGAGTSQTWPTDTGGFANFGDYDPGEYAAVISKSGYQTRRENISFNGTDKIHLELDTVGAVNIGSDLQFEVRNASGAGIGGALITLINPVFTGSNGSLAERTDGNGFANFGRLQNLDYIARISHDNYNQLEVVVSLNVSKIERVVLTARTTTPPPGGPTLLACPADDGILICSPWEFYSCEPGTNNYIRIRNCPDNSLCREQDINGFGAPLNPHLSTAPTNYCNGGTSTPPPTSNNATGITLSCSPLNPRLGEMVTCEAAALPTNDRNLGVITWSFNGGNPVPCSSKICSAPMPNIQNIVVRVDSSLGFNASSQTITLRP